MGNISEKFIDGRASRTCTCMAVDLDVGVDLIKATWVDLETSSRIGSAYVLATVDPLSNKPFRHLSFRDRLTYMYLIWVPRPGLVQSTCLVRMHLLLLVYEVLPVKIN